jgi:ATP-dependent helicase/nuclease subunit B
VDELDAEIDKRDFGLWLHHVLQEFHQALQNLQSADLTVRRSMLNAASEKASHAMGLDAGEFLPFAASWPRVREGYLHWLTKHEAQGRVFKSAENECRQSVSDWLLEGRIDRIDTLSDGTLMVLDYKTEPEAKTKKRVSNPLEDTQMAFYAALLPQDTVAGAYVNISEKETKDAEQKEVVQARDALIEGLVSDMQRIGAGAPMPALGEASACEFCNARGLCRKDFWAPV